MPQPYLCIQPPPQSPSKIFSSTSANFHLSIPPCLFTKPSLQSPQTLSFSMPQQFFTCQFLHAYSHPYNLNQKHFRLPQLFSPCRLCRWARESCVVRIDTVLETGPTKDACVQNGKPSNILSPIFYIYYHHFHILLFHTFPYSIPLGVNYH